MRSDYVDAATRSCDAIQLSDKGHHIRHMFCDVTADDLIKFVIRERIRNDAEVMNHISMTFGVGVDPDRSCRFVPAATNVENFPGWAGAVHVSRQLMDDGVTLLREPAHQVVRRLDSWSDPPDRKHRVAL